MTSKKLALLIAQGALDRKCLNLEIIDVRDKVDYTDYVLLCSGSSPRQVRAIADSIDERLRKAGERAGLEGRGNAQWVLMDYGDVVVHIFHHPLREHYDIEGLWLDAERLAVDYPPELRVAAIG